MAHYICTGTCKGGADKPGACEDEHCSKHGEPLEECECTDAQHAGRQDASQETRDDNHS